MSLVLTAPPAVEPVSLAEAKAHLRVDSTAEDALVSSLIVTSRLHIEAALALALVTQSWTWTIDAWQHGRSIALPMRPVASIDGVSIAGRDGTRIDLAPSDYVLDGSAAPARLTSLAERFPRPGTPALGIEIRFTAGFGGSATDVPQPICHALLMLVAHWFENREPVLTSGTRATATPIPDTVSELLAPYRTARI